MASRSGVAPTSGLAGSRAGSLGCRHAEAVSRPAATMQASKICHARGQGKAAVLVCLAGEFGTAPTTARGSGKRFILEGRCVPGPVMGWRASVPVSRMATARLPARGARRGAPSVDSVAPARPCRLRAGNPSSEIHPRAPSRAVDEEIRLRAIVVDRLMEPGELTVSEHPDPEPGPGEVLLRVQAAACNFSDLLMLRGKYQEKPAMPFVLGREAAGVVVAVGEGVSADRIGRRVFALTGTGAFAEQALALSDMTHDMPDDMPFDEGAALPIVYPTSYAALVFRADLQPNENLLVHAAAGGVGVAAVQIGKALGARVIATAGGAAKLEVARQVGADVCIDSREGDFAQVVLDETGGRGADVIYDSVGGEVFERSLKCIAWDGRLVVVGFASGTIPEVKANRIMLKNIAITGLHWPAYREHAPEKMADAFRGCSELYRTGCIRPLIRTRVPLDRVGEALEALDDRSSVGKLIVEP